MKSSTSLPVWDSTSPRVRKSKMTGTCSQHLTLPKIIRHATCRIHSSSNHTPTCYYAHTSSVQSRVMEVSQPPIRIICPGRVYRNEAISYRAHCFFHQVEALYVDKDVSFTDLKQVLLLFAQEMFGADTKIRLRPSYFPFTEPSAEMDISCNICGGKGCPFCKHTGWVEILGCGMVDPNVLDANGIDSKVYSGYALGMGIERITNLKYQVKDLRMFSENDTRFLKELKRHIDLQLGDLQFTIEITSRHEGGKKDV